MFKLITKTIAAVAIVSVALFGSANAKTLKIETHFTASSPNGEVAAQFAKNVEDVFWRKLKNRNVLLIISNR
jgi:TRAP-type C4-dicarboxylate transport system substrate-binding protein